MQESSGSVAGSAAFGRRDGANVDRYDLYNAFLTNTYDRMQRGKQMPSEFHKKLVNQFITRSDAQNYMILGDPAPT